MAETPDEIFERTLAEEQAKGSSPQVAQARAKAARMRASKGLFARVWDTRDGVRIWTWLEVPRVHLGCVFLGASISL